MKLEQQCVNLELAKRLKELGVKQKSYFYWTKRTTDKRVWSKEYGVYQGRNPNNPDEISAFTVAELGEMLPHEIINGLVTLKGTKHVNVYLEKSEAPKGFVADTEADARAKMLIYLLENKLITTPNNE
jgi:hypothetical protein